MQGVIRYTRQRPGSFTVDAVEAMRALEAMGREPVVLGYHPSHA